MAFMRASLELAIPMKAWDKIPNARKIAFRDEIRAMKALAVKINDGSGNEEMTVKAQYHVCHHDENNVPCEPTIDI